MKKIITTLFALAVVATATYAQPQKVAESKLKYMDQQLDLSTEQEGKLLPILVTQAEEQEATKKMEAGEEKNAANKASFQKFQKGLRSVLTPEQLTAWKELTAKQAAARKAKQQQQ